MIIDHVGFGVSNYDQAKDFYSKALAPLGIVIVMEVGQEKTPDRACGFGRDGKPEFWIGEEGKSTPPIHLAFVARTRAEVDNFYKAALNAGAKDNGEPGIRAHYHPNYYAAFVLDLDGHNIEAVPGPPLIPAGSSRP